MLGVIAAVVIQPNEEPKHEIEARKLGGGSGASRGTVIEYGAVERLGVERQSGNLRCLVSARSNKQYNLRA